ncbi:CREB-regulated transcription coactivator 3-like [Lagenorhynchus albirostris]|uniref:CREB-regulated transcription coactivator 3-like n=1 Tax=Lagenorhynchus albirostris TaxID=27610 RepID=UPI0028E505FC|nr:CREB-regulated transcription coactivator 3-like [Lagenorhynchus albirostris]
MVSSDRSPLSFLPTEAQAQVSPPPPYPTPQDLPQPLLQQPQAAPSLPQSDFQLLAAQGSSLTSFFPDVSFEQQSVRPGPAFTQQLSLVQQGPREPQDSFHLRPNLYSNCGNFPNTILTEDSSTSLFIDLGSALAGMPEVSLNVDTPFPLQEELQIEPLSLDGLSMLSDSSPGLLDLSTEETFRADRLLKAFPDHFSVPLGAPHEAKPGLRDAIPGNSCSTGKGSYIRIADIPVEYMGTPRGSQAVAALISGVGTS